MTKRRPSKPKVEPRAADAVSALEKLLTVYLGLASRFQPGTQLQPNPHADDKSFRYWSERACECARFLAPYQRPMQRTVTVPAPRDDGGPLQFTLRIFEGGGKLVRESRDGRVIFEDEPRPKAVEPDVPPVVIEATAEEIVEPAPAPAPPTVVPIARPGPNYGKALARLAHARHWGR